MKSGLQVVAIDGSRGTGKSRLAAGLRSYFGCGVLELGPIFRIIAWLVKRGYASDPVAACEVLDKAIEVGWIRIRHDIGGSMAASSVEVNGQTIEDELWNTDLDEILRSAAESPEVISCVGHLARRLIGSQSTIVIGREVGSQFFPDASLKIVLRAKEVTRRARKLSQLTQGPSRISSTYSLDQSEPARYWEYGEDTILIDTTLMSPEEVFQQSAAYIEDRLGWKILQQYMEAHGKQYC